MEFQVFGAVRLRHGDQSVALSGTMQRTLLGVLLSRPNQPVSVDVLSEALWPGRSDSRNEQKLQLHVHRLRRALGESDRLQFGPGGYRLTVLPDELDADRFETLVDEASGIADDDPARCVELIRKALDLWTGEPYEGLDVPEFATEAQRLTDRRLDATELLYRARLASGEDLALVADLRDLVRQHPLRERLYAVLMVALHRGGRRADALRVYQDARQTLVDELGLEPGAELQRIEQAVLAGEAVDLAEPTSSGPVPAQLPARPRGFVGRETELAEIEELASRVDESATLAVLSGTAGVGKTALAVASGYRVRDRFPDGQLHVDLRGYGPERPLPAADVLASFLRALGLEGAAVPSDLDDRAARFRSLLDRRRMLLVLDNARTVDQVRPLLPGTPSCFVIVTSRDSLTGLGVREGAHRIGLDRLAADEASQLLRELVGADLAGDPASIERLVEQCARLPLALRIAADLVRTRPARGIGGLVDELADERHRLDLLDVDDAQSAVRAVFSWSYQQLSSRTARVFRMCGLHPGHDFDAYALAALGGVDLREARRSLDTLVRAHLVDEKAGGRFQPHDLLRAYARELAESTETDDERQAALSRLATYYVHAAAVADVVLLPSRTVRHRTFAVDSSVLVPPFASHEAALWWMDAERSNLLLDDGSGDSERVIRMSSAMWHYLETGGYYQDGLDLHGRALEAARDLGDRTGEIDSRRYLGMTLVGLGRHEAASAYVERALELCRQVGDLEREASVATVLAAVCHIRGELRDAVRYLERRREIVRELGDPADLITLTNLAFVHGVLGDYGPAFAYAEEALSLAESTGNRSSAAHALRHLATVCERTGRLDDAETYAHRLLNVARNEGVQVLEASALDVLGAVHRRRAEYAASLHYHRRGLEIARAGGGTDEMAEALNGIGRTLRADGDPDAAVRQHEEALSLAVDGGYRHEEANARAGLGDASADLDDSDAAREHWQSALAIYQELGVPEADEVEAKLGLTGDAPR